MLQWLTLYNTVGHLSPYPIEEYCVLGHAVGSTELLHPASVVAVQHLLADAGAVGAGTPGMILVTRSQVMFEEKLTAWSTGQVGYYVISANKSNDTDSG